MKGKVRKNKARNRFLGITSRVLMLIVAALLALSYLSIIVNPADFWFLSIFGILYVPLMTLNLFLLLWAIKRKSKSFLIPLLFLIPSFFFIGRYVQLNSDEAIGETEPENSIKIVSWNVGRFSMHNKGIKSRQQCVDSVFNFLKNQNADIICLQEFHVLDDSRVRAYIRKQLKGYNAEYYLFTERGGYSGNLTLSKFPVRDKGKIKFEESANLAIYTDYRVKDRNFRVYNCHFESYNVSFSGVIKALARRASAEVAMTGHKVKRSITRRPKQVDKVFSDIERCPVESFVCGFFNDNPMSYTYHRMTRHKEDSLVEAGDGFGATYSLLWPMLRLDYILYPERFRAISNDIPRVNYSDHYPVITEIEL